MTQIVRDEMQPPVLASRLRLVLARLGRRVRQEGVRIDDDLTPSRAAALSTIEKLGPLTLGQLAAVERVTPPSMTRIVARLEERGLAFREMGGSDRRVVQVHITEEGCAVLTSGRTRRDVFLTRRVESLTIDERTALACALPVLEKLLEDDG